MTCYNAILEAASRWHFASFLYRLGKDYGEQGKEEVGDRMREKDADYRISYILFL